MEVQEVKLNESALIPRDIDYNSLFLKEEDKEKLIARKPQTVKNI